MKHVVRCRWAVEHPELISYHDTIWGHPVYDDSALFGAYVECILHAGLLWTAMLKKRPLFEAAFDGFDIARVARYDGSDIERLMRTEGMIRNFVKINAVIHNARRIVTIQREFGSFSDYLWGFVNDEPIVCDHVSSPGAKPAQKLSHDLRARGFKFAGESTSFGLMQDAGLINDHETSCFCYPVAT